MTVVGRDVYLGRHGTPESRSEYDRLIAEWLTTRRQSMVDNGAAGADLAINEMLEAYLHHADAYDIKNGRPSSEPGNIRPAVRLLRELYGLTLAW